MGADQPGNPLEGPKKFGQQEIQLLGLARTFLIEGKPREAFELVKRSAHFDHVRLVLLGKIWISPESDGDLKEEVVEFFKTYVARLTSTKQIVQVIYYFTHPERGPFDPVFLDTLATRRKELDPTWDGVIEVDPNIALNKMREDPVESINDPELCLDLVAYEARREKIAEYFERYLALGGDPKNVRYLKVRLNKILLGADRTKKPEEFLPDLMQAMAPMEFRFWVQANSKEKLQGSKPEKFARTVLAFYVLARSEELSEEDWIFVARRSLDLTDRALRLICFTYFKAHIRTQEVQRIFEALSANIADEKQDSSGTYSNEIYDLIGTSVPVTSGAAKELQGWAKWASTDDEG